MKKYIKAKWNKIMIQTVGIMAILVAFSLYGYAQDEYIQDEYYQLKNGHPRIIMTKYDELALRFAFLEDSLAVQFSDELKRDADIYVNEKPLSLREKKEDSILESARLYLNRILTLSLAYRIFDNDVYSDKAIEHMLFLSSQDDWNPEEFEGTATITAALSIGYDWNFYHINGFDREKIRNSIVEKGLNPGLAKYDIIAAGEDLKYTAIKEGKNVIEVAGLTIGALAVGEDFPLLKNKVVYSVVSCLVTTLNNNADDIWSGDEYNKEIVNNYLTMLISSLNTSLGHDFGLSAKGSLQESIQGYVDKGSVAVHDNTIITPSLLWYSKNNIMRNEELFKTQLRSSLNPSNLNSQKKDHLFYLNIVWYN